MCGIRAIGGDGSVTPPVFDLLESLLLAYASSQQSTGGEMRCGPTQRGNVTEKGLGRCAWLLSAALATGACGGERAGGAAADFSDIVETVGTDAARDAELDADITQDASPDAEVSTDADVTDSPDIEEVFDPSTLVDLSQIPMDPACADGVWVPTPSWPPTGFRENFWGDWTIEFQLPPTGGVVCGDGFRMFIPARESRSPRAFTVRAQRDVPYGAGDSLFYSIEYLADAVRYPPPSESILVVDVGRTPGVTAAGDAARIFAKRLFANSDPAEDVPIFHLEETDFGWRIYLEWFHFLSFGRDRPSPLCGNGVRDPDEECDPLLPSNDDREDNSAALCSGRCETRFNAYCNDTGCFDGFLLQEECERPTTYCWERLESAGIYGCGGRPVRDGQECDIDDPSLRPRLLTGIDDGRSVGVCRGGECVPEQGTECESCELEGSWYGNHSPVRLVDGACREAYAENRVGESVHLAGECIPETNCFPNYCTAAEFAATPEFTHRVSRGSRVHLRYQHIAWSPTDDGEDLEPTERYELEVEYGDPYVNPRWAYFDVPVEPFGEVGEWELEFDAPIQEFQLYLVGGSDNRDLCALSEGLRVLSSYVYTVPTDLCEIAFDVDGDVATCPIWPSVMTCDEQCVDPLSNDEHCGACGNVCGPLEACVQGVCACHPALMQVNPSACDGCPAGMGGRMCERACLGQVGEGVYCGGNGVCPIGPYGDGVCRCDPGYHGPACEFSCRDGVRNGEEWNVDCGGEGCGFYCGLADDSRR
jgi:hypothetical protein